MPLSPVFQPVSFRDLPGWQDDDHAPALEAFTRSALHAVSKPYRTGALGVESASFAEACEAASAQAGCDSASARAFFERFFTPAKVIPSGADHGFVTGFYEPEVEASPVRTGRFRHPLLGRPADLVDLDDGNRPAGLDPYLAFGRATGEDIVEYFDRGQIDRGALDGRGLELVWLADPVDVYFIHVQGATRLVMPDGTARRFTYAAKSGQRFTGAGKVLVQLGEIPLEEVTMQSIRAWFRENPQRVNEVLWRNRSFIFFRETDIGDPALGPVAAAKVQLTPGRSVAVDRLLHTFGTPFHIAAPSLAAFGSLPFSRLMIAQDTGSAIVGAARGDLFAGSGSEAGEIAGVIRHAADFYALLPNRLLARA